MTDPLFDKIAEAAGERRLEWMSLEGEPEVLEALDALYDVADTEDGTWTEYWLAELGSRLERVIG